jgi:hypothetical protein
VGWSKYYIFKKYILKIKLIFFYLVYMEDYKDLSGLEFLENAGLEIVKY